MGEGAAKIETGFIQISQTLGPFGGLMRKPAMAFGITSVACTALSQYGSGERDAMKATLSNAATPFASQFTGMVAYNLAGNAATELVKNALPQMPFAGLIAYAAGTYAGTLAGNLAGGATYRLINYAKGMFSGSSEGEKKPAQPPG